MDLISIIVLIIIGLFLIIKGGNYFVDSAIWIAKAFRIPNFIIGATIVSIATTSPEIFVSSYSSFKGEFDLSVGNALGSVIFNIGIIMSISIMFLPSIIKKGEYLFDSILLTLSSLIILLFSFKGKISVVLGIVLLLIYFIFIAKNILITKIKESKSKIEYKNIEKNLLYKNILKFIIGIVSVIIGSRILVDNASNIAILLGVPSRIIGVTILAIGTSLPELITTITSIIKKQPLLSIGNIVGANILNLTVVIPISTFISNGNILISSQLKMLELPLIIMMVTISIIPSLIKGKFYRWQGFLIAFTYIFYFTYIILNLT